MPGKAVWLCSVLVAASVWMESGCRAAIDAEAEKAAVARVIEANIGWFKDKDFGVLFGTCSQGPDLLMFQLDSASTIHGFAELERYSAG